LKFSRRGDQLTENTGVALLAAALVLQVAAVGYYCLYFDAHGYLPAPFIYNKFDTFMDLYNSMWWGADPDKYTVWQSVYPPLNFLVLDALRLATYGYRILESGLDMRDQSLAPALVLSALYVLTPFILVAGNQWRGFSPQVRFALALFAAMSPPFLFGLERGNLIVLALLTLPLVFSTRTLVQVVGIAVAINLKPYFALLLFGYLIFGEWRRLLLASALSGAVFIFTGLLNDPNFPLFLGNLLSFSQNNALLSGREIMAFPSSLSAFSFVLNIFIRNSINANDPIDFLAAAASFVELIKAFAVLFLAAALIAGRRTITHREMWTAMITIMITMGIWAGGYSQIFYLACVPTMIAMKLRKAHLFLLLLIYLPLDNIVVLKENLGLIFSFLKQEIVDLDWQLGLGSVIRPIANTLLLMTLGTEFFLRGLTVLQSNSNAAVGTTTA
jgi:hypothetical protein